MLRSPSRNVRGSEGPGTESRHEGRFAVDSVPHATRVQSAVILNHRMTLTQSS